MPSQFFGLNTAYKGLLASNAGLNTTSNNIANVNTIGYSRQQVVQQASDALRVFQTYGCAGAGVDVLAIERIRDEFYDRKYWTANTMQGEYSMKQYYMQELEVYFADTALQAGFKTIFDRLITNGLQEVLKNSGSTSSKAQYVGYAGDLTEYFNGMAANLEKAQEDVNQEIKLKIDQINSLASEIASLNKQINVIELTGAKANELRDRRTVLLDELSNIVNIEVKEFPIVDPNHPDRETGSNRFIVRIGGGQLLVDTADCQQLECVARPSHEKVNQTDIDGLYEVYWSNGEKFNLHDRTLGGALQGLVELRDGNNSENFNGTITAVGRTDPDENGVTRDTVTIEVTDDFLKDLNKCNLSDSGGVISLGNQLFYYDSWSYICTDDGNGNLTYSYTFVLSDSTLNERRITNDRVGKVAEIGNRIDYQGIPYYMKQMNEWVRTFAQKFNDILNSGYNKYGELGVDMFTAKKATDKEQYTFDEAYRYDHQTGIEVHSYDDSYYKMTAKNFEILTALLNDPDLLATSSKNVEEEGVDQYDILKDIQLMVNDKERMSFRGCKASEFLQCILSDVALNASNANTFCTNYTNICQTVDNQRISISGVDEDEEAVNLVRFQNAYNLASRMIQTLTEVYDRLILQTGV